MPERTPNFSIFEIRKYEGLPDAVVVKVTDQPKRNEVKSLTEQLKDLSPNSMLLVDLDHNRAADNIAVASQIRRVFELATKLGGGVVLLNAGTQSIMDSLAQRAMSGLGVIHAINPRSNRYEVNLKDLQNQNPELAKLVSLYVDGTDPLSVINHLANSQDREEESQAK